MMKIYWITLIAILGLCPQLLFSQAALQEIVRFDVPYGNYFMNHVEGNGDINGDGTNDIIYACGENSSPGNCLVHVYIHHSIPDSIPVADQILTQPNQAYEWGFGCSMSYAGDINDDGIEDLLIGSNMSGYDQSGAVHIYFGGDTLSPQPDVSLYGEDYAPGGYWLLGFGSLILSDCDINGDGIDDIVILGPGQLPEAYGNVFVFFGGQPFDTTCDLHLFGTVENERLGNQLATGDINGDGFDDIVLTRQLPIAGTSDYYQYIDIYSGGVTPGNVPVYESMIGSNLGGIGYNILANGDLNGDGLDDIVMSYKDSNASSIKIIYGCDNFDSLEVSQASFNTYTARNPLFYCNLNNDIYSDFCMWQNNANEHIGYFTVYEQVSPIIDLVNDFVNPGESLQTFYGKGFLLGDINHDGHQEFYVYSSAGHTVYTNYATILTESYVEANDETIPSPESGIFCYPNPFKDRVNVKITSRKPKPFFDIAVYDIKGRKVYSRNKLRTNEFSWTPVKDCKVPISSGIYLMQITENNRLINTSKVIYTK